MTKDQVIRALERYQEHSGTMEVAMAFGVALTLVRKMSNDNQTTPPLKSI